MSEWKQPSLLISGSCFMMSWSFKSLELLTAPAHLTHEDILCDPYTQLSLQVVLAALVSQPFLLSLALTMLCGPDFCILNMRVKLAYFFLIHNLRHKMLSCHLFLAIFCAIFPIFRSIIVISLIKGNTLHLPLGLL